MFVCVCCMHVCIYVCMYPAFIFRNVVHVSFEMKKLSLTIKHQNMYVLVPYSKRANAKKSNSNSKPLNILYLIMQYL